MKKLKKAVKKVLKSTGQLVNNVTNTQVINLGLSEKTIQGLHYSATESGLFNFDWYQAHYGSFEDSYTAFKDYLNKSVYSNVNPSALFDNEYYQRMNMDIYHQNQSPLAHFMLHGSGEGRASSALMPRWTPNEELHPKTSTPLKEQKIAICLHIYYNDFIERFYDCLSAFPVKFDVFITIKEESEVSRAKAKFSSISNCGSVKVAIAPNRGRNFGPMLVNFSDELLEYDLMCHLHSKKSLYSGREQTQWSDYLNTFLLKDAHVVSMTLRHFEENPEFGLYFPTSFPMMPCWVNHWTCNKHFAAQMFEDWGIKPKGDFLAYPVGGMFWARPKAIKQMLKQSYAYDDFPEEPLPNDGSWLHALERAMALLPEKNGYKSFYYHPPLGKFTTDSSYITSSYFKPQPTMAGELNAFDIVSFDIFDTVARRKYFYPDYAKMLNEKWLLEEGFVPEGTEFVRIRNEAEFDVRKSKSFKGDVDIFETYQHLEKKFGWNAKQSKEFATREFEYDLSMMLPKQEMVDWVNELSDLGKEIIFVTDIYYTVDQIELLLKKIGVTGSYSLYVSTDIQKRKDTGEVWQFLKGELHHKAKLRKELSDKAAAQLKEKQKDLDKTAKDSSQHTTLMEEIDKLALLKDYREQSFLHVGDNVRADAQLCGDFGFQTMHILNPYDKWLIAGFEDVFSKENVTEKDILKWGPLICSFGRYPFFGE